MNIRTRTLIRRLFVLLFMCSGFFLYFSATCFHSEVEKRAVDHKGPVEEARPVAQTALANAEEILREHPTTVPHTTKTTTRASTTSTEHNKITLDEEPLLCDELKVLVEKAKQDPSNIYRSENLEGNRGVFYANFYDKTRQEFVKIVLKEATIKNVSDFTENYRYNSAVKEIKNLRHFRTLDFHGVPRIWGACIEPRRLVYAVTNLAHTTPMCGGNGTDTSCAYLEKVIQTISATSTPKESMLTFIQKAVCFFEQFQTYNMFMEDLSGGNFHFDPKTWDLYIVDADSIIFYGEAPLLSRMSCRFNRDCPQPSGNFWPSFALNYKIYYGCAELYGICHNNTCEGVDVNLHTCGIGRWFVTTFHKEIPIRVYRTYTKLKGCMMSFNKMERCSISSACEQATSLLKEYQSLPEDTRDLDDY